MRFSARGGCCEAIDGQHPGAGSSITRLFLSMVGSTDMPLCKERVSLEAHLITFSLDSKSPVPCQRKMFYRKSPEAEKVKVTLGN